MSATVQHNLPTIIEMFNHEKPFQSHAFWYVFTDVDNDGTQEFCITDYTKNNIATFKISSGKPERIRTIPQGELGWTPLLTRASTSPSSIDHCSSTRYRLPRTASPPTMRRG